MLDTSASVSKARFLLVSATLFLCLWASPVFAQVSFSNEDRATVRVMAVQGVASEKVRPPTNGSKSKPIIIGVAEAGHGTGVMVTHDGIIATAQHVINDAEFVAVKVPGYDEALMAFVLYENKKHDVAFLKVAGHFAATIPVPEELPELQVRSQVYALGYPIDGTRKNPQSSAGVVAGEFPGGELQLGLSVNPGNSGGPLLDDKGTLLGLVVRTADVRKGWQGIAVAVPIKEVKKFYERRVLGSRNLERARVGEQQLKNSAAAAEVVSQIASISSIGTAIDHIEESTDVLKKALVLAERSHRGSADFLALLAAHYWNESVIRFSLGGRGWKAPLDKAGRLARKAVQLDARIVDRSPFLYSALGRNAKKKDGQEVARRSAPRTIAGFRLGWSLEEAQDACTIEDLSFEKTRTGYRCDEPPTSGAMEGPVDLTFCEGTLCRVDVLDRPSRALSSLWVNHFKATYRSMSARYGKHATQKVQVPAECRSNLLACLEKGKASLMYRWTWKGRSLQLTLAQFQGKPTMRLILSESPGVTSAKKTSSRAPETSSRAPEK